MSSPALPAAAIAAAHVAAGAGPAHAHGHRRAKRRLLAFRSRPTTAGPAAVHAGPAAGVGVVLGPHGGGEGGAGRRLAEEEKVDVEAGVLGVPSSPEGTGTGPGPAVVVGVDVDVGVEVADRRARGWPVARVPPIPTTAGGVVGEAQGLQARDALPPPPPPPPPPTTTTTTSGAVVVSPNVPSSTVLGLFLGSLALCLVLATLVGLPRLIARAAGAAARRRSSSAAAAAAGGAMGLGRFEGRRSGSGRKEGGREGAGGGGPGEEEEQAKGAREREVKLVHSFTESSYVPLPPCTHPLFIAPSHSRALDALRAVPSGTPSPFPRS